MLAKNDKSSRISMVVGTSSKAFNENRMHVTTIVISHFGIAQEAW